MKAQHFLLMVAALVFLGFDDVSKRRDLTLAETRADVAEKDAAAESHQIELLVNEVSQMQGQGQLGRPAVSRGATAPDWFTNHLNGTPTVLDPQGGNEGRARKGAMPPP